MDFKPNTRRKDIENRANVYMETDPEGDARKAHEQTDPEAPQGVRFVGGGLHGKLHRGVTRISKRGSH